MNDKKLKRLLGSNIRRYRSFRSLSQAELAEMIDISIPFLSDIENGKKWISPKTFTKLADAFKIEAYELLRPEHSPPDDVYNIIEKYSSDVYDSFGKSLNSLRDSYISQIKRK
jgi:transcriptional regulator with XRE-family HTH domain